MSDSTKVRLRGRWRVLVRQSVGLDNPGYYQEIGSASSFPEAEVLAMDARRVGFQDVIIERDHEWHPGVEELPRK